MSTTRLTGLIRNADHPLLPAILLMAVFGGGFTTSAIATGMAMLDGE